MRATVQGWRNLASFDAMLNGAPRAVCARHGASRAVCAWHGAPRAVCVA